MILYHFLGVFNSLSRMRLYGEKKCTFPTENWARCDYKSMRLNFKKTYQNYFSQMQILH